MFKHHAMLLLIFASTISLAAADSSENISVNTTEVNWTPEQVAQWAADHSPVAKLLESERSALTASIDRDDRAQRAQVAMTQNVIRELICQERNRSAAQALTVYHQFAGLQRQIELLDNATETLEQLLKMADKADELDIKDGNRFELDKQRLQIVDQQAVATEAKAKLSIALNALLGKPDCDEIKVAASESLTVAPVIPTLDEAISIAISTRCDLKAIEAICRSLSTDTLPAARQLLGVLQPGLGIAIALASKKHLLAALHQADNSGCELMYRREQCAKLQSERQNQIETQVRIAYREHQTATERLKIAQQLAEIDSQVSKQSVKAIELDQAKPGTDLVANLELLKAQGRVIEREVSLNVATVKLQETMGTVLKEVE